MKNYWIDKKTRDTEELAQAFTDRYRQEIHNNLVAFLSTIELKGEYTLSQIEIDGLNEAKS